jgi:hypothetical protein
MAAALVSPKAQQMDETTAVAMAHSMETEMALSSDYWMEQL